jgi:hypothetical protein
MQLQWQLQKALRLQLQQQLRLQHQRLRLMGCLL